MEAWVLIFSRTSSRSTFHATPRAKFACRARLANNGWTATPFFLFNYLHIQRPEIETRQHITPIFLLLSIEPEVAAAAAYQLRPVQPLLKTRFFYRDRFLRSQKDVFRPCLWGKGCLQWSRGEGGEKESRAVQYGEGSSSRYPTRFASSLIRCANYGFVFFLFGIASVVYAMRYDTTMQCIMVILRVSCHYLSFITCHHHLNGPCYYCAENHLRLLFLCESYKAILFKISWEVTERSTLRVLFWTLHIYF